MHGFDQSMNTMPATGRALLERGLGELLQPAHYRIMPPPVQPTKRLEALPKGICLFLCLSYLYPLSALCLETVSIIHEALQIVRCS